MGNSINIGQIVSFGVGGADRAALNLIKGLLELNVDLSITVFYNKHSHPRPDETSSNPSRFEFYKKLNVKLQEFTSVVELNEFNIDVLNTHRSGDDNWFLPNFENTQFKFKVCETNFHGYTQTKSDLRIYPSIELAHKNRNFNIPYKVVPNPILSPLSNYNLRNELNICNKFVYGRIARPDASIYSKINLEAYKKIETDNTVFLYVAPNKNAISDAKSLGIKNIIFLEPTSDDILVDKIMNTFDVLCHSNSLGETFGNTIAEAMIYGKPVISHIGNTTWPQAHKALFGDMHEHFIENDIVNNYSKLMLKLQYDNAYYDMMSKYFKNRAMTLYDYKIVAQQYFNIYKTLYL